jgi:hypothetical protein
MAIDFMVMPLSRYISGDFITPEMRFAWAQGISYRQIRRDGIREFPRDTPFGGPGASEHRNAFIQMLYDDLRALPQDTSLQLWDERAVVEPRYHRVDPTSFGELLAEASRRDSAPLHVTATLFLPAAFVTPFEMTTPFACLAGSTERALRELEGTAWGSGTTPARETLIEALRDSAALKLPVIVDS